MKRFPELKPNFWDVIVVLAVIALAAVSLVFLLAISHYSAQNAPMETTLAHLFPEMTANIAAPVLTILYGVFRGYSAADLTVCTIGSVIMGAMVIYMHRSNIKRIREGKEYRFGKKHQK